MLNYCTTFDALTVAFLHSIKWSEYIDSKASHDPELNLGIQTAAPASVSQFGPV